MSKIKTCVVFGVTELIFQAGVYRGIDFYIFDEDFIPVSFDGGVITEYKKQLMKMKMLFQSEEEDEDGDSAYQPTVKDPSQIALPFSCEDHYHINQSYASFRGRVFRAGGSTRKCKVCRSRVVHHLSKRADFWDTNSRCWTRLPDMNIGRERLELHVLKGKLYAVGGTGYDYHPLFIERLDEESISGAQWTPLSPPPTDVRLNYNELFSAAFEEKGFILFGSDEFDYFYAYRPPPDDTWTPMLNLPFHSIMHCHLFQSQTVVGNCLIWLINDGRPALLVFDINDGSYVEIDLGQEGLFPTDRFLGTSSLVQVVYVGDGVLAIIWGDAGHYHLEGQGKGKCDSYKCYHCCRFTIDFVKAKRKCCKFFGEAEKRCPDRKKCCKLLSHQTCIGPRFSQDLDVAFVVDVVVPAGKQKRGRKEFHLAYIVML